MKKNLIYTGIIIATLLMGFIIGFLVSGRMTKQRIKRMRSELTDQGFNREFRRVLQPTPAQMEELKPILRKFASKRREAIESMQEEQAALFEEFRSEIDPYLTVEQIERLEEMNKRHKKRLDRGKKKGRRGGAPPNRNSDRN